MDRQEILIKLTDFKRDKKEKYALEEIGIFGSVAKNEITINGDIDVVVKLAKPDLFILGHIKSDLEKIFGKEVDVVRIRKRMNDFLKQRILKEAVYV